MKVLSAPFQPIKDDTVDTPLWKQPEVQDLMRTLAIPAAFTALALIVVFGAIRPAINAAKPLPPAEPEKGGVNAVVDDATELPKLTKLGPDGQPIDEDANGVALGPDGQPLPALEAPGTDLRLENARKLAKENPVAMATLIRGWINKE